MVVLTTVQITNNTGKHAKYVHHYNFSGHLTSGQQYPPGIVRGGTVNMVFEDQKIDAVEISGAVVYRIENEEGNQFDWMYAWYNKNGLLTYKAYTEIAKAKHDWKWNEVEEKLKNSVPISHAKYENWVSDAIIIQPLFQVVYQGRMSLEGGSKA